MNIINMNEHRVVGHLAASDGGSYVADHSLAEGMAAFMPIYRVIRRIPFVANISNKIVILKK